MSSRRFVQYICLKVDPQWRRLPQAERDSGRAEFTEVLESGAPAVTSFAYSTLGLKVDADILIWWHSDSPEPVQELLARLLISGLGRYCNVSYSLFGLTRPSQYTKVRTTQEHALDEPGRLKYLIVYPFTKTIEWYLLPKDVRQTMMNEHMKVGHGFDDVRQVLLYTTGLDDHEFVVAYETDNLERHHELVVALRSTESRRYTLSDTPIFTAIHRPIENALALLG